MKLTKPVAATSTIILLMLGASACSGGKEALSPAQAASPAGTFVCQKKLDLSTLRLDKARHVVTSALPEAVKARVMTTDAQSYVMPLTYADYVSSGFEPSFMEKDDKAFLIVSDAVIPQYPRQGLSPDSTTPTEPLPPYNFEVEVLEAGSGRTIFTQYTTLPNACLTP